MVNIFEGLHNKRENTREMEIITKKPKIYRVKNAITN